MPVNGDLLPGAEKTYQELVCSLQLFLFCKYTYKLAFTDGVHWAPQCDDKL